MMGSSSRFDHAPDYYFCTAFWLLANYSLGSWAPEWEGQAWYSNRWPDGKLPTVDALKAEPKQVRRWRGEIGIGGQINGVVRGGAGLMIQALRGDGWVLAGRVGTDERYELIDVPLERYQVSLPEVGREQEVFLTRERPVAAANFDLTGSVIVIATSVIRGTVRGGAGYKVLVSRPVDGWSQEQVAAANGAYSFTGLVAGAYTVTLVGAGDQQEQREGVVLDGRNEVIVDLAAPGWGWEVSDAGPAPGFGVVRCRVKGRFDTPVRLWAVGWEGITRRTGTKPEYGADVCEFAPLGAGRYSVQPGSIDVVAEVNVDGQRVHWLTFTEHSVQVARPPIGALIGVVSRPPGVTASVAGWTVQVLQLPGTAPLAYVSSEADGAFRFDKLTPGKYTVQLLEAGLGSAVIAERTDIRLDAGGQVRVDLVLPATVESAEPTVGEAQPTVPLGLRPVVEDSGPGPGFCVVRCRVVGQPGRAVSLWTWGWGGITEITGSKPKYGPDACEFAPLGPGTYFVELEETDAAGATHTVRTEIHLESNRIVWVSFDTEGAQGEGASQPPPSMPVEPPASPTISEPTAPEEPLPAPEPALTVKNSVIGGTVVYPLESELSSDGLLLLLAGPEEVRQATASGGQYAFFGLPAGVYRLTVLSPDPALGNLAVRENIVVDGVNQVTVDLELSAPMYNKSRVSGRAKGGGGRIVLLEGPLADEVNIPRALHHAPRTTTIAQDETYAFDSLGPGAYRATVLDTEPPTGSTQTQAGILLDGRNTAQVDFDLDALRPGKTIEHYLLVGSIARAKDDFLVILRYVARYKPVVGSDESEARQARHVTILGGASAVSAMTEQGLRLSGCQVQRIESDFAAHLGKYLEEGRPY